MITTTDRLAKMIFGGQLGSLGDAEEVQRKRIRGKRGRNGLTLVEVLVAMALLVIVVAAVVAGLFQVAHASHLVRMRTTASALAWSRVERARHMAFDEIDQLIEAPPGNRINASGLAEADGPFRRQTVVEILTNSLAMKRIRVDVWPRNQRSNTFEGNSECVETIITDVPLN